MNTTIHPTYYPEATVTCSCGNTFATGSTLPELKVEICSKCHPFFTGEMRFVDTQGRVDKFEAARKKAEALQSKVGKKKAQVQNTSLEEQKTLKEMIQEVSK